jgi:hypothetical protein
MLRLLALLLLTSPSAAYSQAAGQIFFGGSITSPAINAAKCSVTNTSDTIGLTWTIQLEALAAFNTTGEYRVYAASKDQGTNTPFCYRADDTATSPTWRAGELTTNPASPPATSQSVITTSVLVKPSEIAAKAGYDCSADADAVHLCVLWYDAVDGTTPRGWAKGTVSLKVVPPGAPTISAVAPDEKALFVSVDPAATGVAATKFRARARAVVDDGTGDHYSALTAIDAHARIEGLVNDRSYYVWARSYSAEENESADSAQFGTAVSPQPVQDAWEHYKLAGGRDSGGCQAGGAGLVALLGAATLLRLRRRS